MGQQLQNQGKILIVDDDLSGVLLLKRFFEDRGYTVLSANTGLQVVDQLEEIAPDLIITDVVMPKMNGYEFLEKIRQTPALSWIPVIFLSAKTRSHDRIKGLSAGANAYIIKPFSLDELMAQVETLLRSSQLIRQNLVKPMQRSVSVPTGVKLTNAELAVAKLVTRGLSNQEIAQTLVTSKRTVESHISHMLRKTELSNRTELSRWILENGLD